MFDKKLWNIKVESIRLYFFRKYLIQRDGNKNVCGKIAAYPGEDCHPDHYQCVGKYLCRKPQTNEVPEEGGDERGIRKKHCKGLRGQRLQRCLNSSSQQGHRGVVDKRRRPCFKYRVFPILLKRCRQRNGIRRNKREARNYVKEGSSLVKNKVLNFRSRLYRKYFL